jgi:hypothetical protein
MLVRLAFTDAMFSGVGDGKDESVGILSPYERRTAALEWRDSPRWAKS